MKIHNILFLLAIIITSALGCGGDGEVGEVSPQEEENNGAVSPECPSLCALGERRCEGDEVVVRCVEGPEGCAVPEVTRCAEGEVCAQGQCEPFACPPDRCSPGTRSCLDEATVTLCVADADGCGIEEALGCGEGTRCDEGRCVARCVDEDGDGFGVGCEAGPDCDDLDPQRHPGAAETCDGADEDCDGEVDEGFAGLGEPCERGEGACRAAGLQVCAPNGEGVICGASPRDALPLDLCGNGLDDDCDGEVDEDHPNVGAPCALGVGACAVEGAWACAEGGLVEVCEGTPGEPSEERCDGIDNDCDGLIDEGFQGLGASCSVGQGACQRAGTTVCAPDGLATACDAQPGAPMDLDLCGNDIDDDCDGFVDEGYPDLGDQCAQGMGQCRAVGVRVCAPDRRATACSALSPPPGPFELCGNGLDDDCDGQIDEGFQDLGTSCSVGQGACGRSGARVCSPDRRGLICSAQEGAPGDERCDGVDNDCDGDIDEGFALGEPCAAGLGLCQRQGITVCAPGGLEAACSAQPGAATSPELCGNSLDDDCDGDIDEGFEDQGDPCAAGLGLCRREGALVCAPDRRALRCSAQAGAPALERCDGRDNDCDGAIDGEAVCGACVEDAQEPDDVSADATPLSDGQVVSGSNCFFNRDLFEIQADIGDRVVLNVLFSHADGDLDVAILRDGQPVTVVGGTSVTDNEQVRFTIDAPGRWVAVLGQPGGEGAVSYRLSAQIGGDACADDVFEDDDTQRSARPLPPGVEAAGAACASDRGLESERGDWFALGALEAEVMIEVDATFSHSQGDIDVTLRRDQEIVASGTSVTDNESFSFLTQTPGEYFVQVFLFGESSSPNSYRLRYTTREGVCQDDGREPDDTAQDPNPLLEGQVAINARLCEGDDDWFLFDREAQPGEVIQANLWRERAEGMLSVELYRVGQVSPVRAWEIDLGSNQGEDRRALRHRVEAQGRYLWRLRASGGQPRYTISHVQVRADGCVHDEYETDSFLDVAAQLAPGQAHPLTLCLGGVLGQQIDFDLVALGELPADTVVSAESRFVHANGNIELALFHQESGEFVAQSNSQDDNEALFLTLEEAGTYFLVSWLAADGANQQDGNNYTIFFEIQ